MKRTPLRRRSRTNSNRHVDQKIIDAYKLIYFHDELIHLFPGIGRLRHVKLGSITHYVPETQEACHAHHLCGGANGSNRVDHTANLVSVCQTVHDWLEKYRVDGVWLCLRVKLDKREFDRAKLNEILGLRNGGDCLAYFSLRPVQFEWVQDIKESVLRDAR